MSWWSNLQQRCRTCSRVTLGAGLLLLTLMVGGVLLIAGAAGLAWTNTEQFCIGCHEMRDNVYAEFKGTIHDVNRSGVRAICSNCHVPHQPWPLIKAKVLATHDLWSHIMGHIDTKEKFEKQRYALATRVWTRMKANDSLECRNCHHADAMDADKQSERARKPAAPLPCPRPASTTTPLAVPRYLAQTY
jgi:cytochrome c-type protein NapC